MDDGTFRDIFEQVRMERDPAETDAMIGRYMQHFRTVRPAGSFDTPEKEAVSAWSQENQDWEPCRPHGLYHALDGRVCAVCLSFGGDPSACSFERWGSNSSRTCSNCRRSFCPGCMGRYKVEESDNCPACHQHFRFHITMRPNPAAAADWRTHCTSCGAPLGYVTDMGTVCAQCESRREWTARQEAARRDDYWRRHIEGE